MADERDELALLRWRVVLGKFSERGLAGKDGESRPGGAGGQGPQAGRGKGLDRPGGAQDYDRMDRALDFLYGREYENRGVRSPDRSGGSEASALTIPDWLKDVRELFPRETV